MGKEAWGGWPERSTEGAKRRAGWGQSLRVGKIARRRARSIGSMIAIFPTLRVGRPFSDGADLGDGFVAAQHLAEGKAERGADRALHLGGAHRPHAGDVGEIERR